MALTFGSNICSRLGCEFILLDSPDGSRRSANKSFRQGASPPVMTQAFLHSLGAKGDDTKFIASSPTTLKFLIDTNPHRTACAVPLSLNERNFF